MAGPSPDELKAYLRENFIVVHHAVTDAQGRIVLYLEYGLGQQERATDLAIRYPGVKWAAFDDPNSALLYVTVTT